jgi:hypothetical protein
MSAMRSKPAVNAAIFNFLDITAAFAGEAVTQIAGKMMS